MSTRQTTVEDIVTSLRESDLETADKLLMFVTLCDTELLLKDLNHHALMVKMEMSIESNIHSFAYGVLKIAHPHLFLETIDKTT